MGEKVGNYYLRGLARRIAAIVSLTQYAKIDTTGNGIGP
jgi:hypothetical protein